MRDVNRFLSLGTYAIAGVSRDPKKFGQVMFRDLRKKGMDVVPVNPAGGTIDGVTCYKSVSELPSGIRGLIFMTPKEQTLSVAREAISHGIKISGFSRGQKQKRQSPNSGRKM
jgi:predicted CoA-binding protein